MSEIGDFETFDGKNEKDLALIADQAEEAFLASSRLEKAVAPIEITTPNETLPSNLLNKVQRSFRHLIQDIREWRELQHILRGNPSESLKKIKQINFALHSYRLSIISMEYKAPKVDEEIWKLYQQANTETERLKAKTFSHPLFINNLKTLRGYKKSWENLFKWQEHLVEIIRKAPESLVFYNKIQILREERIKDELTLAENEIKILSAKNAVELAIGYVEQLNREGRVTHGSPLLNLDDAQNYWKEQLTQILQEEQSQTLHADEILSRMSGLETIIREAPNMAQRISDIEEKFSRIISTHDILVSNGKTIIPQNEISRVTVILYEKVPKLWASGRMAEINRNLEALESFNNFYEGTIETEFSYMERRRPGLTRSLALASEPDKFGLSQVLSLAHSFVTAIDSRDRFMRGHSEIVSQLSTKIARKLEWKEEDLEYLTIAGLLHDVGKISIPESLLTKTDPLTVEDWKLIQKHPYFGAQIIKPVTALGRIVPWVYHHQERWDGKGYPEHLSKTEIPDAASIIAVAEAFSVMTIDMPNRAAIPKDEAIESISQNSGTQFSPIAVEAFVEAVSND